MSSIRHPQGCAGGALPPTPKMSHGAEEVTSLLQARLGAAMPHSLVASAPLNHTLD